ncbi:MAG: hypothetical protein ABI868_04445 [Acidobacteriota bacterium]
MKRTILLSMVITVAVGLGVWPSVALRIQAANAWPEVVAAGSRSDARPEALITGGALLVLASILRRNLTGDAR